jgi:hypothetical protein
MASLSLPLLSAVFGLAAVDAASPACKAALVADCSTVVAGSSSSACEVCTGLHQHELRLAGCSAADAASFCATRGHPDPNCKHGLPGRGRVCCSGTCGTCGGSDCGSHPGGPESCCTGKIEASKRSCDEIGPPCIMSGSAVPILTLQFAPGSAPAFPPGRRHTPAQLWAASPVLPLAAGPGRPAADLMASGEAAMLAWTPTAGAKTVVALSDSHSLVRLLGGGSSAAGEQAHRAADGDVVLRDREGRLVTQWSLLWSRLDPWVNESGIAHPILVLDNVPYAFCDPTKCNENGSLTPGARYGMDYGPHNVSEYAEWIGSLLEAMIVRYGEARASSFWFRVATEPNTRPGHWNDTNQKYADEYAAVSAKVVQLLPRAKVGLANMGADGSHWDDEVTPMAQEVVHSGARVDFIAMSCYGRGTHGRYSIATAALCSERLASMRALGGKLWAELPAQTMEYGLQQNTLNLVDDDPGVFGGAWQLATSVAHAQRGVERCFQWHFGELAFAHDKGACSTEKSPSKCSLYSGRSWVQAMAGHLFNKPGTNGSASLTPEEAAYNASVLMALHPGSNATVTRPDSSDAASVGQGHIAAVTSADGIGGWAADAATTTGSQELRLLLTAFSPETKTTDGPPVTIQIAFTQPSEWATVQARGGRHQVKSASLNRSTSPFDAIWRAGAANDWLTNASDPNVYPLSKAEPPMLTRAGRTAMEKEQGAALLAMQRETFSASDWQDAPAGMVECGQEREKKGGGGTSTEAGDGAACTVSVRMTPPSVMALWVRAQ